MQEGTTTRDAFQIADALDALGAEVTTEGSLDLSFVRLRALTMNLAGSLDLFADIALHPAFSEEMVQLGRRRQLARIAQEKAQPIPSALRLAPRLLYGEGHPYAAPFTGTGTETSVQNMGREELAAWHRTWFRPGSATLIVAGDISMDEAAPQLERAFGSWKGGKAPDKKIVAAAAAPSTGAGAGGRVYLIDKPDAPQSVIVAMQLSEPGGRPEDLAMETVMRAFGGMATSRLNRNLRLDKHWSYGVNGTLIDARGQRPLSVIAPVQTDKTKESMVELARELRGIAGERPIRGEEFDNLLRGMVSRLPSRFQTLAALEAAAEDLVGYGYPPEYYYDYASNVRALKEADLAAAAARFIHPERVVWIVVGDLKKVEAGIRELGYGELVRLDADGRPVKG
jgi:zinc protease